MDQKIQIFISRTATIPYISLVMWRCVKILNIWFTDWSLTPTLEVFHLYHGKSKFYKLMYLNTLGRYKGMNVTSKIVIFLMNHPLINDQHNIWTKQTNFIENNQWYIKAKFHFKWLNIFKGINSRMIQCIKV